MTAGPDRWHRWLLDVRFGGDAAYREKDLAEFLYPVRHTVLDKAQLVPGDTLLDVGAGDGLIAFGALERLGKEPVPWERFVRTSGNPLIPTFEEALHRVLSPEEAAEFTRHLRPLVESGAGLERIALAYLTAAKN